MNTHTSSADKLEKTIQQMTVQEIVALMRGDSLLNRVRQTFYSGCAEMEQANEQRQRPSIIEVRKREFLIAQRLIKDVLDSAHRPEAGEIEARELTLSSEANHALGYLKGCMPDPHQQFIEKWNIVCAYIYRASRLLSRIPSEEATEEIDVEKFVTVDPIGGNFGVYINPNAYRPYVWSFSDERTAQQLARAIRKELVGLRITRAAEGDRK